MSEEGQLSHELAELKLKFEKAIMARDMAIEQLAEALGRGMIK